MGKSPKKSNQNIAITYIQIQTIPTEKNSKSAEMKRPNTQAKRQDSSFETKTIKKEIMKEKVKKSTRNKCRCYFDNGGGVWLHQSQFIIIFKSTERRE